MDDLPPTFKSESPPMVICVRCNERFPRQQELDRHIQTYYLPKFLHCPRPGCSWRGHRTDYLQTHWKIFHEMGEQKIEARENQIYDVKLILEWIREGAVTIQKGGEIASELVKERAEELGKEEWLDHPWGPPERRARSG
ncbi:hypothetical protein BC826DRAFT_1037350 [Russula brevipes]|nr:hypothetical protein BC826DRAFT_1037350 [Russula brevipes]